MPLPTTTKAYFNEHDKFAAAWLRELIKAGQIADGDVDERDIQDVQPKELDGYTQVHMFAGIGVWSYALRQAGWPDDRPVWTGSCPCQPFSAAGQQQGHADPRHLWPEWFRLIRECQPQHVFGEQVEAALRHGWLDLVSADLEGAGYAIGAAIMGAHSVGAPHRRHRLYFVGERTDAKRSSNDGAMHMPDRMRLPESGDWVDEQSLSGSYGESLPLSGVPDSRRSMGSDALGSADTAKCGRRKERSERRGRDSGERAQGGSAGLELGCVDGRDSAVGDGRNASISGNGALNRESTSGDDSRLAPGGSSFSVREYANRIGATRGFWADCDWWYGKDGKYRPIGAGITPLVAGAAKSSLLEMVDGTTNVMGLVCDQGIQSYEELETGEARVMRLRGYGNAIVVPCAEAFITAYLEVVDERV